MKKLIAPLVLMLLPLLLAAGVFDGRKAFDFNGFQFSSRAWRLAQQLRSYYNGTDWIPGTRVIPYYNSNHPAQADSMYMDVYDDSTGEWMYGMTVAYLEYNAAGRMVRNTMNINFFGTVIPIMLLTADYNSQNRIQNLYMYRGGLVDLKDDYWVPTFRLHLIQGTGTTFEVYGWEEGEDEKTGLYFHSQFDYDTQGRVVVDYKSVSQDSLNWVQDGKTEYTYHPQDTTTGANFIEYASANLAFMMMNDGFEFPGLITEDLYSQWTGTAWIPTDRSTYQFNPQAQRTLSLEEYHDGTGWVPGYQLFYNYYDNGQLSYTVGQTNEGAGFANDERYDYTWEQYGSANEDPVVPAARLQVKAYPSPFTDELRVETASPSKSPISVNVYNLRGQLVRGFQKTGSSVIWDGKDGFGRNVPTGVYLLKVSQDGRLEVTKVLRIK